jgi:Xaa-Pro aminopeptidase
MPGRYARYAYTGHYIGLSVHDVGDWDLPFEAGMVMAIEPIIDLPGLHIRIEDSVLVTPTGIEILSTAVPKEIEDVIGLLKQPKWAQPSTNRNPKQIPA